MKKDIFWVMNTTLLLSLLLGCSTKPPPDACLYGLPTSVATTCGCSPVVRDIDRGLAAANLPDNASTSAKNCVNGSGAANVKDKSAFKVNLDFCLGKDKTLDVDLKTKLIALVDKYYPSQNEVDQWNQCYGKNLNPVNLACAQPPEYDNDESCWGAYRRLTDAKCPIMLGAAESDACKKRHATLNDLQRAYQQLADARLTCGVRKASPSGCQEEQEALKRYDQIRNQLIADEHYF
jgi:hypothetical protein